MNTDTSTADYMPLGSVITGNTFIALLQVPLVWVLTWGGLRLTHTTPRDAGTLLLAAALVLTATGILVPLYERPFITRAHHPSPGGIIFALGQLLIPPAAALMIGQLQTPRWALVLTTAVAIEQGAYALWVKPWKRGMSANEVRDRLRRTREMTDNTILNSGWTPPPAPNTPTATNPHQT